MNEQTLRHLFEVFDLKNFLQANSPIHLMVIFGIMCVFFLLARFLCALVEKKLEKYFASKSEPPGEKATGPRDGLDIMDFDMFEKVMRNVRRLLYLCVLYWGLSRLALGQEYFEIIRIIFVTLCIWAGIEFFTAFVPFNLDLYLRRHGATLKTSQSRSLLPIVKGLIWAIGLTFMLDNLGFHVSTIIAGLGIVGVAVGLAGQAILADFFSYIVILLDKPFRIGDFVELSDGKKGSVEYMGPKTTHLRNLAGDLIICANSEMTKGILVNQGSLEERLVDIGISISYSTPIPLLRKFPDILRDIVDSVPGCHFERATLLNFGASNLQFQLLYHIGYPRNELLAYMQTQSEINMTILAKCEELGISMDYPTEHVLINDLDAKTTAKLLPSSDNSPKQNDKQSSNLEHI